MSFADSTGSTDGSSTSISGREVGSFLFPRDPSVTKPWKRPRPVRGKKLHDLFENDRSLDDSSQHLKVFLRLKPLVERNERYEIVSNKSIVAAPEECKNAKDATVLKKMYNFSHIFDDDSQEDVYDYVVKENLAKFIDGHDYTIMTYGSSGSGKTYSLIGTEDEPGIIPRTLESLFNAIKVDRLPVYKPKENNTYERLNAVEKENEIKNIRDILKTSNGPGIIPESPHDRVAMYSRMSVYLQKNFHQTQQTFKKKYEVWISFAEVYNEAIFDLLRPEPTIPNQPPPRLRLIHSGSSATYIKDLRWIYVRSGVEAFAALEKGRRNLHYAHTNMNKHSSRSHCIFSLKLLQYNSDRDDAMISTFRLCDLAGSERAKRTGNEGLRLAESRKINTSLHVLERCLTALRSNQIIPPYRESKLTSLLQNALCGNEAIGMLVTINPNPLYFDETQHTLQFSAIAKEICHIERKTDLFKSKSCIDLYDTSSNASMELKSYYEDEIERLKYAHEKLLIDREKQIRNQITTTFTKLMDDMVKASEERLEIEVKEKEAYYESQIKSLENELNDVCDKYEYKIEKMKKKHEDQLQELINKNYLLENEIKCLKMEVSDVDHKSVILCNVKKEKLPTDTKIHINSVETIEWSQSNCSGKTENNHPINSKCSRNDALSSSNELINYNNSTCENSKIFSNEQNKIKVESSANNNITNESIIELANEISQINLTETVLNISFCKQPEETSYTMDAKEMASDVENLEEAKCDNCISLKDANVELFTQETTKVEEIKGPISCIENSENFICNTTNKGGNSESSENITKLEENTSHIGDTVAFEKNIQNIIINIKEKDTNIPDWKKKEQERTVQNIRKIEEVTANIPDWEERKPKGTVQKITKIIEDITNIPDSVISEGAIQNITNIEETFTSVPDSVVSDRTVQNITKINDTSTNIPEETTQNVANIEKTSTHVSNIAAFEETTDNENIKIKENQNISNNEKFEEITANTDISKIANEKIISTVIEKCDISENKENRNLSQVDEFNKSAESTLKSFENKNNDILKKLSADGVDKSNMEKQKSNDEQKVNSKYKLRLRRRNHYLNEELTSEKELKMVQQQQYCTPMKLIQLTENQENLKYQTEKKEKTNSAVSFELGCSTVGNSRRKLFARRENNEMAAETKVSMRKLEFEEESPGAIKPPKLEKPYVAEKRSLRLKARK